MDPQKIQTSPQPSLSQSPASLENPPQDNHIVVLTTSTFQSSGTNFYILNNAIQWKNMGLRVTVICQDRNARNMKQVNEYIQGQFDTKIHKIQTGKMRVIVPDINKLIPFYASYQYCQFPGMKSKAVQQMTQQQIQTNIQMTIKCLRKVCEHDRPFKVIANYMITSGIIAARGLNGFNIPYDIIVPGPALIYSVYPYPHLWKWVLPGFKRASVIFQHTEFVKMKFMKCFKIHAKQYQLERKVRAISPGFNEKLFSVIEPTPEFQSMFLQKLRAKIPRKLSVSTQLFLGSDSTTITKPNPKKYSDANIAIPNLQSPQILKTDLTSSMSSAGPYLHLPHHNPRPNIKQKPQKSSKQTQIQQQLFKKWTPYNNQLQIIIYLGALIDNKGVGELLAIAPKIIMKRPTVRVIICGSGPLKEKIFRLLDAYQQGNFFKAKEIAAQGDFITEIGIQEYFVKIDKSIRDKIMIAGFVQQQLTQNLYPFGTLYISPTKMQQSCHMSIVQAMCCGLTPICNDHSWFSQVLNKVQKDFPQLSSIIRVDRGQFFQKLEDTIFNTLNFIKNNKLSRLEYRQKMRQIAIDNFSWNHTATVLAQRREFVYSEIETDRVKKQNNGKQEEIKIDMKKHDNTKFTLKLENKSKRMLKYQEKQRKLHQFQ